MSFCSLASLTLAMYVCLHSSSAEIPHWEDFLSENQRAPENRQCRELPGRLWTVGNLCVSVCVCGPKKAISTTSEPAHLFLLKVISCNFNTCGSTVKNLPASAGDIRDVGVIPGSGRAPGGGNGNPLQFLPGESHGQRSLLGCMYFMGSQRLRHY